MWLDAAWLRVELVVVLQKLKLIGEPGKPP